LWSSKGCTNCLNASKCQNKFSNSPVQSVPPPFNHHVRTHTKRTSNITESLLPQVSRIKLPPASAKSDWNEINKKLESSLPNLLPTALINELPSSELVERLDNCVYSTLLDHFGEANQVHNHPHKGQKPEKMEELRQKKKELKKL